MSDKSLKKKKDSASKMREFKSARRTVAVMKLDVTNIIETVNSTSVALTSKKMQTT